MSDTPELSVVIVNWNAREDLIECLRSLKSHPPAVTWEIVVVDNASRDGSVEAVRAEAPDARLIVNADNRGLAAANNQGMLAARGRVFVISNPDIVWTAGALDELLATLDRHPRAAWVVPRLAHEDGAPQTSAGDLPTLAEALAGRQLQRRRARADPTSGLWWDGWAHDQERQIGRGHEAAYIVRRASVEEVGLQNERYVLDWEGFDWTARLRDAGWEIWLAPGAQVVHKGGTSIRQVPFRWIVSSHRGMYRYFADRSPRATRPLLAVTVASRAGVKLAAAAAWVPLYQRAHRAPTSPPPS